MCEWKAFDWLATISNYQNKSSFCGWREDKAKEEWKRYINRVVLLGERANEIAPIPTMTRMEKISLRNDWFPRDFQLTRWARWKESGATNRFFFIHELIQCLNILFIPFRRPLTSFILHSSEYSTLNLSRWSFLQIFLLFSICFLFRRRHTQFLCATRSVFPSLKDIYGKKDNKFIAKTYRNQ